MKTASAFFFLAMLCAAFVEIGAQPVAPGMRFWRTIRTPHFSIHYPKPHEQFARRMGVIAERTHAKLAPKYRTGATHTHVVLVFDSDLVNAFAFPAFGLDQIVLYLDSPQLGSFSRFDMWAEIVFLHEYVHILSLRYYDKFWLMLWRLLTGTPPNLVSPPGFIEGVAVYEESQAGKGRLFDPLTNMNHRTAMLDGSYPNRGETLSGSHRWPFGGHIYLFGGRFYNYLVSRLGEKRMAEYWRLDILGFAADAKLRTLHRKNLRKLGQRGSLEGMDPSRLRTPNLKRAYKEFVAAERARVEREVAAIMDQGVTPFRRLTFDGYRKSYLQAGEDGQLYYSATPRDRPAGIFELRPPAPGSGKKAEKPRRVRRSFGSAGFTIQGQHQIFSEPRFIYPGIYGFRNEIYKKRRYWFDRRINKNRSSSYPALSSDGMRLYFVERDDKERRLVAADLDRKGRIAEFRVLLKTRLTGLIQFTALAPDDRRLAAVVRQGETGNGSLMVCEVGGALTASMPCSAVARGDNVKIQPRFSPDGGRILFSSDADGIYNLYSVNLATGEARRLTRTVTGFFAPAPVGDDLYALGFFRDGYDIVRFRRQDLLGEPVDYFQGDDGDGMVPYDQAMARSFRDQFYWGPLEMRPFLLGIAGTGSLGATFGVGARDPLSRHFFVAAYDFLQQVGFAQYDYTRFALGLSLTYSTNRFDRESNRGCIVDGEFYRPFCADTTVGIESGAAFLRYVHGRKSIITQFLLGGVHVKLRNAQNLVNEEFEDRDYNLSGPAAAFVAGDSNFYPESISPEHGWVFFTQTRYYHEDYSYRQVDRVNSERVSYGIAEGGFSLYLPSFWSHHVNFLGGYGYGTYGPDRELQKVRLSRFVRGQGFRKSPSDHAAAVFTYEYRFPLFYVSDALIGDGHELALRKVGAGFFVDYGTVFDRYPYREDWVGGYGASLTFGLNLLYLSLPEFRITVARGTGEAGELQGYLSFSAAFGGVGVQADEEPAYRKPYRPGMSWFTSQPGYWRDRKAGGVLE